MYVFILSTRPLYIYYQNQAFLEGRGKSLSITTPHPWVFICNEHHKAIFFGNMAPFKSVLTNTQPKKKL